MACACGGELRLDAVQTLHECRMTLVMERLPEAKFRMWIASKLIGLAGAIIGVKIRMEVAA